MGDEKSPEEIELTPEFLSNSFPMYCGGGQMRHSSIPGRGQSKPDTIN